MINPPANSDNVIISSHILLALCCGLNICAFAPCTPPSPTKLIVKILSPSGMVLRGGAFGRQSGLGGVLSVGRP